MEEIISTEEKVVKKDYKALRGKIIPRRVRCRDCGSFKGQLLRVNDNDASKGYICVDCLLRLAANKRIIG